MSKEIKTQVVVLGAGPAGYSAAFRAADLGLDTIIVERYSTLGGVCLNVGCIPSKALLHVAKVIEEAKALAEHGIVFGAPQTDIDKIRLWKEKVINQLTGGLAGMAKMRKVQVVNGLGKFTGPNTQHPGSGRCRRQDYRDLRQRHHRGRFPSGETAVHPPR